MTMHRPDPDVKKDVLTELKWDPKIKETAIGVIVKDGAVTLTGTVPEYGQKSAARKAAKRIRGVHAIADDIEVKFSYQTQGSDKDIAERIAHLFEWNSQIPGDDIKAEVSDGYVTLTGKVDWNYQRNYSEKQVEDFKGVKAVFNNITLRKHAESRDVKNEIVKALHRHAGIEAGRVSVMVIDGTVTLSGKADTYFERDLIKRAAWKAPGVQKVVDSMNVAPSYSEAA